mgnify:CR=1 FL=1
MKQFAPSCDHNKDEILAVLQEALPPSGSVPFNSLPAGTTITFDCIGKPNSSVRPRMAAPSLALRLMPVQAALGRASGLPEALAPGVHNFAGGAGAGMSVGVLAMLCGLLADGTRPGRVWRLLAPSMMLVVLLGCAAVWLLR